MTESTGKLLGLDYGRKRIGLAVSYATLAEPLTIIENDDRVLEKLHFICAEQHITQIIVGISQREMAVESHQFGQLLASQLALPIRYQDENFTSKIVHEKQLWLQGKARRKEPIDHLAAAEILQAWIEDHEGDPAI
ncbi:Holliday junction resolvase RuvX [Candidatus Woesebacteria bacterium]|nr:Holliday junction resolvase RuvX [Candidatus Woesebacteria bacterium]